MLLHGIKTFKKAKNRVPYTDYDKLTFKNDLIVNYLISKDAVKSVKSGSTCKFDKAISN